MSPLSRFRTPAPQPHTARVAVPLLVLALSSVAIPAAHAQVTYIGFDSPRGTLTNSTTARNKFLASLSSSGTDTLESFPNGTPDPTLSFGATSITATTDVFGVVTNATLATSGTQVLYANLVNDRFTFSTPVTAFDLNLIGAGDLATDPPSPTIVTFRLQNTSSSTSKDVQFTYDRTSNFNDVLFFGVTDTSAFNQVLFFNSRAGDASIFDDVTAGFVTSAAPEPGTIALLLVAGVPGTGIVRRRKANQATS